MDVCTVASMRTATSSHGIHSCHGNSTRCQCYSPVPVFTLMVVWFCTNHSLIIFLALLSSTPFRILPDLPHPSWLSDLPFFHTLPDPPWLSDPSFFHAFPDPPWLSDLPFFHTLPDCLTLLSSTPPWLSDPSSFPTLPDCQALFSSLLCLLICLILFLHYLIVWPCCLARYPWCLSGPSLCTQCLIVCRSVPLIHAVLDHLFDPFFSTILMICLTVSSELSLVICLAFLSSSPSPLTGRPCLHLTAPHRTSSGSLWVTMPRASCPSPNTLPLGGRTWQGDRAYSSHTYLADGGKDVESVQCFFDQVQLACLRQVLHYESLRQTRAKTRLEPG